jgi:hypothetical protein
MGFAAMLIEKARECLRAADCESPAGIREGSKETAQGAKSTG